MTQDLFRACSLANPHLHVQTLTSGAFASYGCTHEIDEATFDALSQVLNQLPEPQKLGDEQYIPSSAELEALPCAKLIQNNLYGTVPSQIGAYAGRAFKLNALEYHKCNEILFITAPAVLLLGHMQDLQNLTYDTSKLEAFFVPANTCVELYSSTMHFSPLAVTSKAVRQAVVQQRFTNTPFSAEFPKPECTVKGDEMLLERNKWVVAHEEAKDLLKGAFIGLVGPNLHINVVEG